MAFGSFHAKPATAPMAEINVIPLVDIMLVLLVIFIITAPLLTHAVKIDLPQAQSAPIEQPAERVERAIDGEGLSYWTGERRADEAALVERLAAAGMGVSALPFGPGLQAHARLPVRAHPAGRRGAGLLFLRLFLHPFLHRCGAQILPGGLRPAAHAPRGDAAGETLPRR